MATTSPQTRTILERFPTGGLPGSWPAEQNAVNQRTQGTNAQVVVDLRTDQFLVVTDTTTQ
ncbi:hypothetical protein [Streptomyces sp. 1222.5]|uniref:hypothetical protein n=1 Tax=Streptomyces sp. 1222.5 TaxID=1881026 RepID=UPI003D709E81